LPGKCQSLLTSAATVQGFKRERLREFPACSDSLDSARQRASPVNNFLQITVAKLGGGRSVSLSPASGSYSNGAVVVLNATPLPGWTFLQWLGDASGSNPSNSLRVTRNTCVQAVFGTALGTTVAGSGSVVIDPVVMNQSKVITATFTSRPRIVLGPCEGGMREDDYRLTLHGDIGVRYQIDTASSLPDWAPLVSLTNVFGTAQFTDAMATNQSQRFYRARVAP